MQIGETHAAREQLLQVCRNGYSIEVLGRNIGLDVTSLDEAPIRII